MSNPLENLSSTPVSESETGPNLARLPTSTLGDYQWQASLGSSPSVEMPFGFLAAAFTVAEADTVKVLTLDLSTAKAKSNAVLVFANAFAMVQYQSLALRITPVPFNGIVTVTVAYFSSAVDPPTTLAEMYGFDYQVAVFSPAQMTIPEPLVADFAQFSSQIKPEPFVGGKLSMAFHVNVAPFGTSALPASGTIARIVASGKFRMAHTLRHAAGAALV